LHIDLLENDE